MSGKLVGEKLGSRRKGLRKGDGEVQWVGQSELWEGAGEVEEGVGEVVAIREWGDMRFRTSEFGIGEDDYPRRGRVRGKGQGRHREEDLGDRGDSGQGEISRRGVRDGATGREFRLRRGLGRCDLGGRPGMREGRAWLVTRMNFRESGVRVGKFGRGEVRECRRSRERGCQEAGFHNGSEKLMERRGFAEREEEFDGA